MSLLVLVPARGGSKGLPGKNARTLGDLPLLAWTAEAVRASGTQPDALVLSTDDSALADIGRRSGLDVPFMRPASLAGDEATAVDVIEHALDWFAAERGIAFDLVAWLQPTSPFRPPTALTEAVTLLAREDVAAVIGVKDLQRSPSVLFHDDSTGRLVPLVDSVPQSRRQDVRSLWTPNGALYVMKSASLRATRSMFPPGTRGIPMDQIASIDIDDAKDWALAEAVVARGLAWR